MHHNTITLVCRQTRSKKKLTTPKDFLNPKFYPAPSKRLQTLK